VTPWPAETSASSVALSATVPTMRGVMPAVSRMHFVACAHRVVRPLSSQGELDYFVSTLGRLIEELERHRPRWQQDAAIVVPDTNVYLHHAHESDAGAADPRLGLGADRREVNCRSHVSS